MHGQQNIKYLLFPNIAVNVERYRGQWESRANPGSTRTKIQVHNCCSEELSTTHLLNEEKVDTIVFPKIVNLV
jgi:hypothetical protein